MGFLTFDCVACKKTRYVSKKIRCTPPPGEQTFICASCLRLSAPAADAEESLACGRAPAKNFYEIYLQGGTSPREILTESTPRFNGQSSLESGLTSSTCPKTRTQNLLAQSLPRILAND